MKDKIKIINSLFWILTFLGVLILLSEYFVGFISSKILLRGFVIYFLSLFFYLLVDRFLNKIFFIKIIFIVATIFLSVFYLRYAFITDLAIIVIPKDYKGKIYLTTEDEKSIKTVRQLDGIILIILDNKGVFKTKSKLDLDFTKIAIVEQSKDSLYSNNRNIKLVKEKILKKPFRFEAEIIRLK